MKFPDDYNNKLLNINETLANITNEGKCVFEEDR